MENILDEILDIANGGCSADQIQAFIKGEKDYIKNQEEEQATIFRLAKENGATYTIHFHVENGYSLKELRVNGYDTTPKCGDVWLEVKPYTFPASSKQLLVGNKKVYDSSMPDIKAESTYLDGMVLTMAIPPSSIISLKQDKRQVIKTINYEGKTIQEIKLAIGMEVSKAIVNTYYAYNNAFINHTFFTNGIKPQSNRRSNRLTIPEWWNLIKLLYPTITTTDRDIACEQIEDGALLPRDFGIKNVDALLQLYCALLRNKLNAFVGINNVSVNCTYTQANLIKFVQDFGGTFDGCKVSKRKVKDKEIINDTTNNG